MLTPGIASFCLAAAPLRHMEAFRFSRLIVSYGATAYRLGKLRSKFLDDEARGVPVDLADLVDRTEEAISVENQGWMAGWSGRR